MNNVTNDVTQSDDGPLALESAEKTVEISDSKVTERDPEATTPDTLPGNAEAQESALTPLQIVQQKFALMQLKGSLYIFEHGNILLRYANEETASLDLSNLSHGTLLIERELAPLLSASDARSTALAFRTHPDTVCYKGIEFNPKETTPGYLNLWVGPTIQPIPGDATPIKDFILEVICNGNRDSYGYLMGFLAHALQRPQEKPGVMITLLGGQGIGKGRFGKICRKIWGASYLQVSKMETILGNFNAPLERAYVVFLDEALFVGDRRQTNTLKSLVTEETIVINEKHQPQHQIGSYHRYILSTNAPQLKHTERDDRRDFALRVSELHKDDLDYWNRLNQAIEGGAVEAFAFELLVMDLSNFNVRQRPRTAELQEQKLLSLEGIDRYWYEKLVAGDAEGGWPDFIATNEILEEVGQLPEFKRHRPPSSQQLVKTVKSLCPSADHRPKPIGKQKARGFHLPPLEVARAEFETWIGGKIIW